MKKTYGNLLDIDGSQLSDDFLQDADNLEKLNTVLNGTEEEALAAYNELEKMAALDQAEELALKYNVSLDQDSFNSAYDEVKY